MSGQILPLARTLGLVVQEAGEETIVYDSSTHKAYVLSAAAAAVWKACNGQRSVPEIAIYLGQQTLTTEQSVWYALGQLDDLLEQPVAVPHEYVGMSRRHLLKLSGAVAAGVAIPMVVKMVAPTPAQAQSGGFTVCCQCSDKSNQEYIIRIPSCDMCNEVCAENGWSFVICGAACD